MSLHENVNIPDEGDSPEIVDICLHCTSEDCYNCIGHKTGNDSLLEEYEWNGQRVPLIKLCQISGHTVNAMKRRLETGGIEYAMSDARYFKTWERERRCALKI